MLSTSALNNDKLGSSAWTRVRCSRTSCTRRSPNHGAEIDERAICAGVDDEVNAQLGIVVVVQDDERDAGDGIGLDADDGVDRPHRVARQEIADRVENCRALLSYDCGAESRNAVSQ